MAYAIDICQSAGPSQGQFHGLPVVPICRGYPLAPTGKSPLRTCAILSHQEGRLAIATNAGQGALDADPLAWRARGLADGEAVWS